MQCSSSRPVDFFDGLSHAEVELKGRDPDRRSSLFTVLVALLICFGTPAAFGFQYEDGPMLTQQSDIQQLDELLKGTSYEVSPQQLQERLLGFAKTKLSHTMRLTYLKQNSLANPEFQARFPNEARILGQNPEASVRITLDHDWATHTPETKLANEGLARTQGLKWRDLVKGIDARGELSPEKAEKVGYLIKDKLIHDVNVGEFRVVDHSFQVHSPSSEFTRVHTLMTAVEDWYDAARFRTDVGANRPGVVQWIEQLEKEGEFAQTPKKDLEFMKSYAKFLDEAKPYDRNPELFAKASALGKHSTPDEYKKAFLEKGNAYAKQVAAESPHGGSALQKVQRVSSSGGGGADGADAPSNSAKVPAPSSSTPSSVTDTAVEVGAARVALSTTGQVVRSVSKTAASAVKGAVVVGGVVAGGKYLLYPEESSWNDTAAIITGSRSTSDCDSNICVRFIRECAKKLNLPADPPMSQVRGHDDFFKVCVNDFLKLPLNEQAKAREDIDLNNILSAYAPDIRNLTCGLLRGQRQEVRVQYDTKNDEGGFEQQKVIFNAAGKVQRVDRTYSDGSTSDLLICSDSKPQLFQRCAKRNSGFCTNYEMEPVREKKLYVWTQDYKPLMWARINDQMVQRESEKIHQCCEDSNCQQFFTRRMADYERVKAKANSLSHRAENAAGSK
jgi:hypothetical protein